MFVVTADVPHIAVFVDTVVRHRCAVDCIGIDIKASESFITPREFALRTSSDKREELTT